MTPKPSKTLLVIGAGPLQLPAIRAARRMGLSVLATDMNPAAPGFAFADHTAIASTLDIPATLAAARSRPVHGVITLATDAPLVTVAAVAADLGLHSVSPDTARRVTDKSLMMKSLADAGIPVPLSRVVRSLAAARAAAARIGYPVVTKPFLGSGSRGVVLVDSPQKLPAALRHAQTISGDAVLIQQALSGRHLCAEAVVQNGRVRILCVVDRSVSPPPHFVELLHVLPSSLSPSVQRRVASVAADGIRALGIESAPCHIDIVLTPSGPVLCEIGARLDGDYKSSHMLPLAFGYRIIDDAIRMALGRPSRMLRSRDDSLLVPRCAVAIAYATPPPGVLRSLSGLRDARRIPELAFLDTFVKPGDTIVSPRRSHDRSAVVITSAPTRRRALAAAREALRAIRFDIG